MPLIDPPRNPFDLRTWLKDLRDYVNILDDEIDNSATDFLSLTDAPDSYTGSGGYVVKVNNTEDGVEFAPASGLGDMIAATYDPQNISADAFDVDNHTDGVTNKVFTASEKTKLSGIATGAEVNVNADWNAVSGDAQILNKPTIPVVSDVAYDAISWNNNTDAPSKNAVRDKIVSMDAAIALNTAKVTNATHTGDATGDTSLSVVGLRGVPLDSTVGTPTDGKILVYRSAGSDWILEDKPTSTGNPAWGDITGTLSAQTDLDTALGTKLESVQAGTNVTVDNTDPLNPIISASGGGGGDIVIEDAVNNAVTDVLRLTHNTTGTPSGGIGAALAFGVETSTTQDVNIGRILYFWDNVNHANRLGRLVLQVNDGITRRDGLLIAANNTSVPAVMIGTQSTDAKLGVFLDGGGPIASFASNIDNGTAYIRISRFDNPFVRLGVAGPSYTPANEIYAEDAFLFSDSPNLVIYNPAKIKFVDIGGLIGAVTNQGFEVPSGSTFLLGEPDFEGSWRFARESDDLVVQRYESGVWTTKHTFTAI